MSRHTPRTSRPEHFSPFFESMCAITRVREVATSHRESRSVQELIRQWLPAGVVVLLTLIMSRRARRAYSIPIGDWQQAPVGRTWRHCRFVNARQRPPFAIDYSWDAPGHPENIYCRSDHAMYARYGIPIAFFTTGLHVDYHQVTDEVTHST